MAGLLAIGGAALAQGIGLGIGIGIDEVHRVGQAAALTPCGINLGFDGSDATGCQFYAVSAFH